MLTNCLDRGVDRRASAEVDHTFPLEFRRKAEDIMIEIKATYHIQVFSGVAHGFALRGNVNDPIASERPLLWLTYDDGYHDLLLHRMGERAKRLHHHELVRQFLCCREGARGEAIEAGRGTHAHRHLSLDGRGETVTRSMRMPMRSPQHVYAASEPVSCS